MSLSQKLSELLIQPKESRQGLTWTLYRLVSPSLTTLEIALAAAIITTMLANDGILRQETAEAVATLTDKWDKFKLLPQPAEALAIVLLLHKGGNLLMSIIEKVIQPLLNAQRQLGHTKGRTEGLTESNAQWRNWLDRKNRAEAEGRPFNEPPPDESE